MKRKLKYIALICLCVLNSCKHNISEIDEKSSYVPTVTVSACSDNSDAVLSLPNESSADSQVQENAPSDSGAVESEYCAQAEMEMHIRTNQDLAAYSSMSLDEITVLNITLECECDLSFLSEAKNVIFLSISNGESYAGQEPARSYVQSFDFLLQMKRLQTIAVYGVDDFSISCFNGLPNLSEVILSACSLDGDSFLNQSVKKLALYGCDFSTDLLRGFPKITNLSIDGKVDDFSFLTEMDQLRFLSLTMTSFSNAEHLSACNRLVELTVMSREGAKATPLENTETFGTLSDLKKLTVYSGSLSAKQKEAVALLLPDCEITEYEVP